MKQIFLKCVWFFAAMILSLAGGCQTRDYNPENDAEVQTASVSVADKTLKLDWLCLSNRPDNSGLNSQEEYCEWTRRARVAGGKLQCEFTTNFDMTRPLHLTMNKRNNSFNETFANSLAFLVGGSEPDTGTFRPGIIPSCQKTSGRCNSPDCVCGRKSDPQICGAIGAAARNGCKATPIAEVAKTFRAPNGSQHQKPLIAVRLDISPRLAKFCFHKLPLDGAGKEIAIAGVDETNERTHVRCFFPAGEMETIKKCDDVANFLKVTTAFKLEGGNCNVQAVSNAIQGKTPNACQ